MLSSRFITKAKQAIILATFLIMAACTDVDENIPHPKDLDRWEYFDEVGETINVLFEDEDGNIWIGTNNGVSRYNGRRFKNYNVNNGLIDPNVLAIMQSDDGNHWFGTPAGISVLADGQFTNIPQFFGFDIEVSSMLQDEDDNVWIGTSNLGLWFSDGSELVPLFDEECIDCNIINTLIEDSDGRVWVGSEGDMKRYRNGSFKSYNSVNGIAGNNITSLFEDSYENLWIGTFDGEEVTRFSDGDFERISLFNSLPQNWITSITEDRSGNLWIGTVISGLIRYDGLVTRTIFKGPPDNTILSMITDQDGNLWVGTSKGGLAKYITK